MEQLWKLSGYFPGGITNNGTFTAGSGVHTFDPNNQALTGTFSIPNVTVGTSDYYTLTNNGTLTVGTALSGTCGTSAQGANATLNIGGTSLILASRQRPPATQSITIVRAQTVGQ